MKSAQDRKVLIQKQLSDFDLLLNATAQAQSPSEESPLTLPSLPPLPAPKEKNPYDAQLEQMKNYLADLQLKYTGKHPDILLAKKKIADLEVKKAEFDASAKEAAEKAEKEEKEKPEAKEVLPPQWSPPAPREVKINPRLAPATRRSRIRLLPWTWSWGG